MIHGLSEEEKFKVIRPIIGNNDEDAHHMPIVKNTNIDKVNWSEIQPVGFQNLSSKKDNSNALVIMFNYDKVLERLWNDPLKYVGIFKSCALVATPDFSVYPGMNINAITYNIYKNRWLGKTWQNYGCNILPTIGWGGENSYDISFSGAEIGIPVIISTLGCDNDDSRKIFLKGFNEMKSRLNPPLIIVFGDMIDGMTGRFINYTYKDAFNYDYQQLTIQNFSPIFEIKGGES